MIHLGHHLHIAAPIESGERHNLIIFCQSHTWRASNRHELLVADETTGEALYNSEELKYACPSWCWYRRSAPIVEAKHRLKEEFKNKAVKHKFYQRLLKEHCDRQRAAGNDEYGDEEEEEDGVPKSPLENVEEIT